MSSTSTESEDEDPKPTQTSNVSSPSEEDFATIRPEDEDVNSFKVEKSFSLIFESNFS